MDYESGEFGRGGHHLCAVELIYQGILGEPFIAFALDRAQRLSLDGWIRAEADGVRIAAQGPQAMVDSFEIVCSLGPFQADVKRWERIDQKPGASLGPFARRSLCDPTLNIP